MAVDTIALANGATLVVEEIPHLRSTAVGVFIRVGSRHEHEAVFGASHFVEHMLFKGTAERSARDIAEQFENLGGQFNAFTGQEYTCVYSRTLDDDAEQAMRIIFDMLFASQFPEGEFTTEKEVIFEEIKMYEDAPDELIHDVFNEKFYAGSSLAHSVLGSTESITALDRDALYAYYQRFYVPDNMIVAVAGKVDTAAVADLVRSLMPSGRSASILRADFPLDSAPSAYQLFTNVVAKEVEQVQICVGTPGMSYHDERRHTLHLMNSILGGGMSSRLFQSLREELGLAYSVYAAMASYSDTGSLSFHIGTGTGKIAQFFAELVKVLEHFAAGGVTAVELERNRQMSRAGLYMGLESVLTRMNRMGRTLMMYGEYQSPEYVMAQVDAVRREDINALAQEMLELKTMSLAAIGPEGILPAVQEEFTRWFR